MTIRFALFWAAVACCVVAQLAILRSVLVGRAGAGPARTARTPGTRRSVEIAWVMVPAIALLFVLYLTWRAVDAPRPIRPVVTASGATIGV